MIPSVFGHSDGFVSDSEEDNTSAKIDEEISAKITNAPIISGQLKSPSSHDFPSLFSSSPGSVYSSFSDLGTV